MKNSNKVLGFALGLLLGFVGEAHGQNLGNGASGAVVANPGATSAPAAWTTATAWLDRWCSSSNGRMLIRNSTWQCVAMSGDATLGATGALTLATVNSNVGSFGSTTNCSTLTVNAKGLVTAASHATCAPAVGSITGFGTNVATALGVNVGSSGAFVTFNGALGTPSSGTMTNMSGTPSSIGLNNATAQSLPVSGVGGHSSTTTGQVLRSSGSAAAWGSALPINNVLVGASSPQTYTMAAADRNQLTLSAPPTSGTYTFNLEQISAVPQGTQVCFSNASTGSPIGLVVVHPHSGDTINGAGIDFNVGLDDVTCLIADTQSLTNWLSVKGPHVKQIVQAQQTTTFNTSSSSYTNATSISLALSEKLQSTISREMVTVTFMGGSTTSGDVCQYTLNDGSSDLNSGQALQTFITAISNGFGTITLRYTQSGLRSSTTPTTWQLRVKKVTGTGPCWIGRDAPNTYTSDTSWLIQEFAM